VCKSPSLGVKVKEGQGGKATKGCLYMLRNLQHRRPSGPKPSEDEGLGRRPRGLSFGSSGTKLALAT
jgi:hypothetical protein